MIFGDVYILLMTPRKYPLRQINLRKRLIEIRVIDYISFDILYIIAQILDMC